MPARPSDPLLGFLRETLQTRGMSTAELAERSGLDRAALKQKLAGSADLTVDEFIVLAQALEVKADQFGLGGAEPAVTPIAPAGPRLAVVDEAAAAEPPEEDWAPDALGNLPRQVLKLGFALEVDMFVEFDVHRLAESGVPKDVLASYPKVLPISLPARYHRHNQPVFADDAFSCVLSFDRLYTCTFPWASIVEVRARFAVEAAAPAPAPKPEPPRPAGPHLRVVK